MRLISKVEIKGFRSIRSCVIEGLGDFSSFAGLNNSGKSNVLRALNAFFNNETDKGKFLDVDGDYYRPDLRQKKAKEIVVSVSFSLPDHFRFRRGLDAVRGLLPASGFTITKRWRRNQAQPSYSLDDSQLDLGERQLIDQFLQLIKFRYVPNRVLPVNVIRDEHQALRDVLVRRIGRRAGAQESTFEAIRETSESVISALARRLHDASPDIGAVRLATPTSWSDMVFAFGYKLSQGGVEVDDSLQGSGIQSLLMLETLYLIDRDYFQKFGWRQAAVWAVEEPESSLHTSLEARVAAYLAEIATDPSSRLQVLCTTHSDLMLQFADKTFMVSKEEGETACEPATSPQEAIERLSREGVSRWTHPVLYYPLQPLILVEGKYDASFLEEAFKHERPRAAVQISYLEKLDRDQGTGGVESLYRYLKSNARVIRSRQPGARVVVVLDWDSANRVQQFEKVISDCPSFKVLVWPATAFNPRLGQTFKGIERHYSDRLIDEAQNRGAPIYSRGNQRSVQPQDYDSVKQTLHEVVMQGLQAQDLIHAGEFVREIVRATERDA